MVFKQLKASIWHPPCAIEVGLAPPVHDSNLSAQSRYWSGWSDQSWLGSRTSSCVHISPIPAHYFHWHFPDKPLTTGFQTEREY